MKIKKCTMPLLFLFLISALPLWSSPPLPVGGCACGEEVFPGEDDDSHDSLLGRPVNDCLFIVCSGQHELMRGEDSVGDHFCCCCGLTTCEYQHTQSSICKFGILCSLLWQCTCGGNPKALFCKTGPCWSGFRLGIGKIFELGCSVCCIDFICGTQGNRCDCHEEP